MLSLANKIILPQAITSRCCCNGWVKAQTTVCISPPEADIIMLATQVSVCKYYIYVFRLRDKYWYWYGTYKMWRH